MSEFPPLPASGSVPAGGRGDYLRLLLIAVQLLALLAVVRVFELETRTAFEVLSVAVAGFIVHAVLPQGLRLPFFAALSVAAIPLALGLASGAAVLGLGFGFITICHLPIPFRFRLGLVLGIGGTLFVLRGVPGIPALPGAVWPVLGSMLMFRLALLLHTLRHQDAPQSILWSTAYLFMLPNACFPLFPVVDYKTFVRNHFDAERFRTYERGIRFMLRGVVHLIAYRIVFYELDLDERYINDVAQLAQYLLGTFLLYLKVSGLFHLVIGVLCLYGFRLPETHHLYYLSSSLTDFWRRINIYWKDFMMKLVYYPSFFRLRRLGTRTAVALSTVLVFLVTWLLHSYQFYWIRGSALFTKRDMAFWWAFGALVLIGALWEMRPGRRVARTDRRWSATRATSTLLTFLVICLLWSVWNMESKDSWLFMWTQARHSPPAQWGGLLLGLTLAWGLAGFGWGAPTLAQPAPGAEPVRAMAGRMLGRMVPLGLLLLLVASPVSGRLPPRIAETVVHLQGRGHSLAGDADSQLGYYEALTQPAEISSIRPWRREPSPWNFHLTSLLQTRTDFLLDGLAPGKDTLWMGGAFTTNSRGMRDREYALAKDPSTFRIAILGASDVMGWGVADGEPFEAVLESRLDSNARLVGRRIEVLNFGVPGTSLAQQAYRVDREVVRFSPDLVVLTLHAYDLAFLERHLTRVAQRRIPVPDRGLTEVLNGAGIALTPAAGKPELRPVEEEIDRRIFRWSREVASRAGANVVGLELRLVGQYGVGNLATTYRAAHAENLPVIGCGEVFRGKRPEELRFSAQDWHPNAEGHRLIAECLLDGILQRAGALGLDWISPEAAEATARPAVARR